MLRRISRIHQAHPNTLISRLISLIYQVRPNTSISRRISRIHQAHPNTSISRLISLIHQVRPNTSISRRISRIHQVHPNTSISRLISRIHQAHLNTSIFNEATVSLSILPRNQESTYGSEKDSCCFDVKSFHLLVHNLSCNVHHHSSIRDFVFLNCFFIPFCFELNLLCLGKVINRLYAFDLLSCSP